MNMPERIKLNIDHPNAGGAEAVLNSPPGSFILVTKANNRYIFRSLDAAVEVELLFFDYQQEGMDYGKQHFDAVSADGTWGMNGGLLYYITGKDKDRVGELAGGFAGRE
jgi:hypothetical protein